MNFLGKWLHERRQKRMERELEEAEREVADAERDLEIARRFADGDYESLEAHDVMRLLGPEAEAMWNEVERDRKRANKEFWETVAREQKRRQR